MRHGLSDILATIFDRTVRQGRVAAPPLVGSPIVRLRQDLQALGVELYDFRDKPRTGRTESGRKLSGRGRARGTRKIENITGVLNHQTASVWDDVERWLNVPAHAGVGPDYVVLLHDMLAYMYHANAGNRFTVGVEVMCRVDGIEGDPRTFWRSKKERNGYKDKRGRWHPPKSREQLRVPVTDLQLAMTRAVDRYYIREALDRGGQITEMLDHRTTHAKNGDPGSRIHQNCTRQVAYQYGLQCCVSIVGSGLPNPTAWSGEQGVPYSGRVRGY